MSEQLTCLGHENGFQHLDVKLGGPEHDLGFKFEEKESAGLAEPVLTLYVSVKDPRRKDSHPTTLHYGLTRSEFANRLSASEQDRNELLKRAMPRLKADLESLRKGTKPRSLGRIVML
jgi:hypothetical protein